MVISPGLATVIHWCVSAAALLFTAYVVPGFEVGSFVAALIAAVVIGFVNATIGSLLFFLTLPINFLTLGLFTFVVDGIVLKMSAALVPNFTIKTWSAAIIGALILTIVRTVLHYFIA